MAREGSPEEGPLALSLSDAEQLGDLAEDCSRLHGRNHTECHGSGKKFGFHCRLSGGHRELSLEE